MHPSRGEALNSFWDRLAEYEAWNAARAEAMREIDPSDALLVDKGLKRCSEALRELRAAHRSLPASLLIQGGKTELDDLRRSLDRTSDALRELKISWQERSLRRATEPSSDGEV